MGLISRVSSRTYRNIEDNFSQLSNIMSAQVGGISTDSIPDCLRIVLRSAKAQRKTSCGLNEVCRALEKSQGVLALIAADLKEQAYSTLVEALARENNIPLVKVDSSELLGEWVGLCKYDEDGNATKVVKCGSVVVTDWPHGNQEARENIKAHIGSN